MLVCGMGAGVGMGWMAGLGVGWGLVVRRRVLGNRMKGAVLIKQH